MSHYVISDIHGCYKEFLFMLDKIGFSDSDCLIIAGDFIDRGKQSYEMLRWIENCPKNVRLIRGNHEEEFAVYILLMFQLNKKEQLETDFSSYKDTAALYKTIKYGFRYYRMKGFYFDLYGTIGKLISVNHVTLEDLFRWLQIICGLPYYYEEKIGEKNCVVVHAGYAERLEDIGTKFSELKEFYIYAREESCQLGGKKHGIVVAGHTPTILRESFAYNKGNVFRYYDQEKDCIFYDIDCGCVFRRQEADAKLACIRLEDEKVFYV